MTGSDGRNDASVLLEASRVFNAAGAKYRKIAEVVSELAVATKDWPDDETRAAILCDAAALRLSGRVAGGPDAALTLLDQVKPEKSEDQGGRVYLLRAFANGQKYKALATAPIELRPASVIAALEMLKKNVDDNLAAAFHHQPSLVLANRHFWDQDAPLRAKIQPGTDPEDDLQMVFKESPELGKTIKSAEERANLAKRDQVPGRSEDQRR